MISERANDLPPGSCDCHCHVFGPAAAYPPTPGLRYAPPAATLDHLLGMHGRLGFERAVLVQTTAYTDHRLLLDIMRLLSPDRCRGIALLGDDVTGRDIEALHLGGFRGVRFNLVPGFPDLASPERVKRTLERVRDFGWIAKFHLTHETLPLYRDVLEEIEGPAILDHMGRPDYARGLDDPIVAFALEMVGTRPNWWVQLSFGHKAGPAPWDAAVRFGKAFYAAAPDRSIWGTDWPHIGEVTSVPPRVPPRTRDSLDLLRRYLPDEAAWNAVLAENPARLFGFPAPVTSSQSV